MVQAKDRISAVNELLGEAAAGADAAGVHAHPAQLPPYALQPQCPAESC